jgi:hypothetical protein
MVESLVDDRPSSYVRGKMGKSRIACPIPIDAEYYEQKETNFHESDLNIHH